MALMEAGTPTPKLQIGSKRDQTEAAIVAALERLLEHKPFAQISIEDLASEAGIQRTAFYFYFANKQDVLARLVEKVADALYEKAQTWLVQVEGSQDELEVAIGDIVDLFNEHVTLFRAAVEVATYVEEMGVFWRALVGRFVEATEVRISQDQQRGTVREDLDPHLTAEALVWMAERYCYQYLAVDGSRDPRQLATTMARIWRYVLLKESGE